MFQDVLRLAKPLSRTVLFAVGNPPQPKRCMITIDVPFWHSSIDHLRVSGELPSSRLERREFLWSDLRSPFLDEFKQSLACYAGAGNNLIFGHILDAPDWIRALKVLLRPFVVYFVRLHCPPDQVLWRKAVRGDRPVGSAERDCRTVLHGRRYDLEIDGTVCARENAQRILMA